MPTTRTYAVGDGGLILRRDNHTGSWVDVSPPAMYKTNWKDVMADPTNPDKVVVVGVCGDNTGVLVSSDAGATWVYPAGDWWTNVPQYEEVWYVDTNTIWMVGLNGYVSRSVNGGLSFNKVSQIPDPDLYYHSRAIHAWSNDVAVVGASVDIYLTKVFKTTDGGLTWTTMNSGLDLPRTIGTDFLQPVGLVEGIWMSQDETRFIATSGYTQNTSNDSGATFVANQPEFTRSGEHLTWFPSHVNNPSHFRHVGGLAKLVALSTDAGDSFTIVRDNTTGLLTIRGAHFYTANTGYYIIEDDIYTTSDGAVTGIINYTGTLPLGSYLNAVWTQAPVLECNCTRFRWDKPSCCLELHTTGSLVINLDRVCAQATENGKVSFVFTSGTNSFKIAWSSTNSRWEFIWINSGNLVLAYLTDDIPCPFGDWIITTNHQFITSLVTSISSKTGIGVDCNDQPVLIEVPFDINSQGNAGNWTENMCLKGWSINDQGDLLLQYETSGLCSETQDGFECRKWYKLIDCRDERNTLCVFNDLTVEYESNLVIQIATFPGVCWRIEESEECTNIKYLATITATFEDCEECLPDQPEVGVACEITVRPGEPGFSTKYCDPEELIKIKCTYADSVYALFKRLRYGIETCCEYDLDKADIKNMLVDLGEMYDPDMCKCIETPVVCCPQPCNVEVTINTPVLIGCPAPTDAVPTIDVPVPPCLDPTGPSDVAMKLCASCILIISAGVNIPPTTYTNCVGELIVLNHPNSKVNVSYSLCIDPTQPVNSVGSLTITGTC